ncbi:hypothetical protein DMENIID0001_168180 [Sergentomyia squamirostris]
MRRWGRTALDPRAFCPSTGVWVNPDTSYWFPSFVTQVPVAVEVPLALLEPPKALPKKSRKKTSSGGFFPRPDGILAVCVAV